MPESWTTSRSLPPRRPPRSCARGDASAREVVEAALRRIEALEPALNAFIEVDGERALAAADAVGPATRQPFAGVPIAIKGNVPVEGWRSTTARASSTATGRTTPPTSCGGCARRAS